MSVRNLEALFQPASVALVGASNREGSLGAVVLRNLKLGGFKGVIWPVNHRHAMVGGMHAWPDVASLPQVPDIAVICTPPGTLPDWSCLGHFRFQHEQRSCSKGLSHLRRRVRCIYCELESD